MGEAAAKRSFVDASDTSQNLPPPLKWAGGKRWLLKYLLPLWQPYRRKRLVEPFVGGMAVALGLKPEMALLNDYNPYLINFYLELQKGLVIQEEMKNDREFFLSQRDLFNQMICNGKAVSSQAAQLFYYLNRTAFNGLCRFNSSGLFNVPFGKYATINYKRDFSSYAQAFKKWQFSCGDFEELKIESDDFIYVDPPYDVEFTKYSKDDFKWQDQLRLVKWLSTLNNPIVASNQATDRILEIYRDAGFHIQIISAPRRIAANGDRGEAMEMLAVKNLGAANESLTSN
jgi:DNA adenine methylase